MAMVTTANNSLVAVSDGLQDRVDGMLDKDATDTSLLLATRDAESCSRRSWKRVIISAGALLTVTIGVAALVVASMLPSSQVSEMRPSGLIHKADANLRHVLVSNVKKFRETLESSEIAESLKIDEGHDVNPIRSPEAIGFTEPEIKSIHEAFDEWDTNRDGFISRIEMKEKMKNQLHLKGVSDVDIMRMIQEGDAHGNSDGRISFKEFASLMQRAHEQSIDVEKAVFQFFDTNKDNQVEVFEAWKRQKELQHGGDADDQMKEKDVRQVIQSVDLSRDGRDNVIEWGLLAE